jgi:F-type H+-transporting ATPase subunit a
VSTLSGAILASGGGKGFEAPSPNDFEFQGIVGGFTKPMLIVVIGVVVLAAFYLASARKAAVVPGRLQFAGESVYGFIRNQVALEAIGKEGLKYTPYLVTLFSFIAVLNLCGIIPLLQFPATSKIAIPLVLAMISWAIFMFVGIRHHGFVKYFKDMMFPPGIPVPVYFLLAPIEFFSNVIVRPVTLCLRLTLNMFAGHLVLVLFILGGEYLFLDFEGGYNPIGIAAGSISIFGSLILTGFEMFVQLLQAYVFTLLVALYIGGALADEH